MKNLELNQMEILTGGGFWNSSTECAETAAAASIAFGAVSWYATAVLGPVGGIAFYALSVGSSLAGLAC